MTADLRLGHYADTMADVPRANALICDPPFSDRTHAGDIAAAGQQMGATGQATRTTINFNAWGPADVENFVWFWHRRVTGWWVVFTDHILFQHWQKALGDRGLYTFAPVYGLRHAPRLSGDGPTTAADQLVIARPRSDPWASWGSLPGRYGPFSRDKTQKAGGKPLRLMREIVADYTDPGGLIVDPTAGYGTTLRAAAQLGRRAIGSEIDPETYAKARALVDLPVHVVKEDRRGVTIAARAGRAHANAQGKAQGDFFG